MDEDIPPDVVRLPVDVARRALALFAAIGVALKAPRREVLEWLTENGLYEHLTPRERAFIDASNPSRKEIIDSSWWNERLIVLLWALSEVPELPPASEQCDTSVFQVVLPPFADADVAAFVARATLRPDDELIAMADSILQLHWQARDAKLRGRPPPVHVDLEIIQERHHAINWIIGYDGLAWDDVTTDT